MTDEPSSQSNLPTGAMGTNACPACGQAYNDHGQGGNCQTRRHATKTERRVK